MNRVHFQVVRLNDNGNSRCVHESFRTARLCAARQLKATRSQGTKPATVKRGLQWKAGDSIVKLGAIPAPSDRWALLIGCAVALAFNGLAIAVCVLCD